MVMDTALRSRHNNGINTCSYRWSYDLAWVNHIVLSMGARAAGIARTIESLFEPIRKGHLELVGTLLTP